MARLHHHHCSESFRKITESIGVNGIVDFVVIASQPIDLPDHIAKHCGLLHCAMSSGRQNGADNCCNKFNNIINSDALCKALIDTIESANSAVVYS